MLNVKLVNPHLTQIHIVHTCTICALNRTHTIKSTDALTTLENTAGLYQDDTNAIISKAVEKFTM